LAQVIHDFNPYHLREYRYPSVTMFSLVLSLMMMWISSSAFKQRHSPRERYSASEGDVKAVSLAQIRHSLIHSKPEQETTFADADVNFSLTGHSALVVGLRQARQAEDVFQAGEMTRRLGASLVSVHMWASEAVSHQVFAANFGQIAARHIVRDDLEAFLEKDSTATTGGWVDARSWRAWAHSLAEAWRLMNKHNVSTTCIMREDADMQQGCFNLEGSRKYTAYAAFGHAAGGAPLVPIQLFLSAASTRRLVVALESGKDVWPIPTGGRRAVVAWLARIIGEHVGMLSWSPEREPHVDGTSVASLDSLDAMGTIKRKSATENVILLVHCRASQSVCEQRRPILQGYTPFFKAVRWLVGAEAGDLVSKWNGDAHLCTGSDDPLSCIARIMDVERESSGILYMHFDAAVSPCNLLQTMDVGTVSTFHTNKSFLYRTFHDLDDGCNGTQPNHCWVYWDQHGSHKVRDGFLNAMAEIRDILTGQDLTKFQTGIRQGSDDLLYMPRAAFKTFIPLAQIFSKHGVFHEIAGPTTIDMTSAALGAVAPTNLGCDGNCCQLLPPHLVRSGTFRCGHKVDYRQSDVIAAVVDLQRCGGSL